MNHDQHRDKLADYVAWHESLTPAILENIDQYYVPSVHFRDPFHDFRGRDKLSRLYGRMFTALDEPRFHVDRSVLEGDRAALEWRFCFRYRRHEMTIQGASFLGLEADGRVYSHLDYWDAAHQIHERIPLLGGLLRGIRRQLARNSPGPEHAGHTTNHRKQGEQTG